jgi:hypothetical protein
MYDSLLHLKKFDHYGGKLTKNMAATLTIMAAT